LPAHDPAALLSVIPALSHFVNPAKAGIQNEGGKPLDSGFPPKGTSFGARRNDGSISTVV
jgi:hypothetical protein